jgi:hypothetical protein
MENEGYWKNRPLQLLRCLFIFILLLHVSALAGHHKAEYTRIRCERGNFPKILCTPPEEGQQGPKYVAAK